MSQRREMPRPGEIYRHFKNRLYQVITVAVHSETGEPLVVYQALYGDFRTWARPLSMFMEAVDREQYPESAQEYRFERIAPGSKPESAPEDAASGAGTQNRPGDAAPGAPDGLNPLLADFFDAEDYDRKLECLTKLGGRATQRDLDMICLALDLKPQAGDIPDQLRAVRSQLLMLQKFDGERLR